MDKAELWYRAEGGYREQGSGDSVWGMVAVVLRGQKYDNNSDIAHCEFDIVIGAAVCPIWLISTLSSIVFALL